MEGMFATQHNESYLVLPWAAKCIKHMDKKPQRLFSTALAEQVMCTLPGLQRQSTRHTTSRRSLCLPQELNRGYASPCLFEVTGVDGERGVNRNEQSYANGVLDRGSMVWRTARARHASPILCGQWTSWRNSSKRRGFQLLAGKLSWIAEWVTEELESELDAVAFSNLQVEKSIAFEELLSLKWSYTDCWLW